MSRPVLKMMKRDNHRVTPISAETAQISTDSLGKGAKSRCAIVLIALRISAGTAIARLAVAKVQNMPKA